MLGLGSRNMLVIHARLATPTVVANLCHIHLPTPPTPDVVTGTRQSI